VGPIPRDSRRILAELLRCFRERAPKSNQLILNYFASRRRREVIKLGAVCSSRELIWIGCSPGPPVSAHACKISIYAGLFRWYSGRRLEISLRTLEIGSYTGCSTISTNTCRVRLLLELAHESSIYLSWPTCHLLRKYVSHIIRLLFLEARHVVADARDLF